MPAAKAATPRGLSGIEIAQLVQQDPQIERRVAVSSRLGPLIGRRRSGKLPALMQQHTKIERRPRVPGLIRPAIGQLRNVSTSAFLNVRLARTRTH